MHTIMSALVGLELLMPSPSVCSQSISCLNKTLTVVINRIVIVMGGR